MNDQVIKLLHQQSILVEVYYTVVESEIQSIDPSHLVCISDENNSCSWLLYCLIHLDAFNFNIFRAINKVLIAQTYCQISDL